MSKNIRELTTMDQKVLDVFRAAGVKASYHYADDTAEEWGKAAKLEDAAVALYYAYPHLQDNMLEISRDFLWPLEMRLERERHNQPET